MEIGNIVTVIMEESFLRNCQGEIVEIKKDDDPDGPIGVRFGRHCSHLFGCDYDSQNIIRFEESDLRLDKDYTPQNKAKMLFRGSFHTISTFKDPLDLEKECMHENCQEKRQKRIMVNAWGVAQEADVCDAHAIEYHGKCIEMFPYKKHL